MHIIDGECGGAGHADGGRGDSAVGDVRNSGQTVRLQGGGRKGAGDAGAGDEGRRRTGVYRERGAGAGRCDRGGRGRLVA